MATGWDGITQGYQYTMKLPEVFRSRYPNDEPGQVPYFAHHAAGMLQVVPLIRANPVFANYVPVPYTSHETLTFRSVNWNKRVEVWYEVAEHTYGVRLLLEGR